MTIPTTTTAPLPKGRKEIISRRLIGALNDENLTQKRICALFSVPLPYVSHMKNKAMWVKVSEKVWRRFNKWEESGETLVVYATENRLMDLPVAFVKAKREIAPDAEHSASLGGNGSSGNGEEKVELVDLRITGLKPTLDVGIIQQRIDQLVKQTKQKELPVLDTGSPIEVITTNIEKLEKFGYRVYFSLELKPKK